MSRYSARLSKLEDTKPAIVAQVVAPTSSLTIDYQRIVDKAKADAEFLETATPLQRHGFWCADIKCLETTLAATGRPPCSGAVPGLAESLNKMQRATIPSFLEDARRQLHQAELDILRIAGFTDHKQPRAQSYLDDTLFLA